MDLPRSQTMTTAYAAVYEKEEVANLEEGAPSKAEIARRKKQQAFEKGMSAEKDRVTSAQERADRDKEDMNYESYTSAYLEGYKPMDQNKMQDKAAMKPDTAKGEKQARKIDKVRAVAKHAGAEQEEGAKLQNKLNKVNPLKRAFKKPAFDKTKNKAYGLEQKRRSDLDKRYGPKKEEVAEYLFDNGYALSEESASTMALHISDDFLESISEELLDEGKRAHQPGGAGEGQGQRPVGVGGFHGNVGGLGRDYKGDKSKGKAAADAQHAADRKAAAKERAERRAAGEKDNPLQAG
jgi:hypothetical protein